MSDTGSSDFEGEPVVGPTVYKKKRNIDLVEPVDGEANVKGFVSAFQTIMSRPVGEVLQPIEPVPVSSKTSVAKSECVLKFHNKHPSIDNEDEMAVVAKRGVLKLFRALSMHKKSGERKERRTRKSPKPVELSGTVGPASMASFLELLKSQKKPTC